MKTSWGKINFNISSQKYPFRKINQDIVKRTHTLLKISNKNKWKKNPRERKINFNIPGRKYRTFFAKWIYYSDGISPREILGILIRKDKGRSRARARETEKGIIYDGYQTYCALSAWWWRNPCRSCLWPCSCNPRST